MFNLYELHCKENGIKAVNEWTYRKIFKKDYISTNMYIQYKRNMYILNFGVHNFHNNNVDMYVWDGTTGSRGAQ